MAPKFEISVGAGAIVAAAVLVPAAIFLFMSRNKIAAAVDETVAAVNPADDRNLVNRGVSAGIQAASDGRFLSLGDLLFNVLNPDAPGEDGTLGPTMSGEQFGIQ